MDNTEENRRKYRQLLFTTEPEISKYISGVIMFHETFYQKTDDGTPFTKTLQASVLKAWSGKEENIKKAQEQLMIRARSNGHASMGKYAGAGGSAAAAESLYVKDHAY